MPQKLDLLGTSNAEASPIDQKKLLNNVDIINALRNLQQNMSFRDSDTNQMLRLSTVHCLAHNCNYRTERGTQMMVLKLLETHVEETHRKQDCLEETPQELFATETLFQYIVYPRTTEPHKSVENQTHKERPQQQPQNTVGTSTSTKTPRQDQAIQSNVFPNLVGFANTR